jgi:hypothetical protein
MSYYLLDSRAGMLAVENNGLLKTEDNGKYILLAGTLRECCDAANSGEYGEHNVVSNDSFIIQWKLCNKKGIWSTKNITY